MTRRLGIATYNVNGVNGRLPRLLEWLSETAPDIVCLQELKTDDTKFPIPALRSAGYDAVWHGQRTYHGVAIPARGGRPVEMRRGLPGERDDVHARYLEAEIGGLTVASIYLPNGNPVASPNYDYKLRWFERLIGYSNRLLKAPAVLAGDLNVVPTDFDVYNPSHWRFDAVMQPTVRKAFRRLLAQGWTDTARHLHPEKRIYTYWNDERAFVRTRGGGWTFYSSTSYWSSEYLPSESTPNIAAQSGPVTTLRRGSKSRCSFNVGTSFSTASSPSSSFGAPHVQSKTLDELAGLTRFGLRADAKFLCSVPYLCLGRLCLCNSDSDRGQRSK